MSTELPPLQPAHFSANTGTEASVSVAGSALVPGPAPAKPVKRIIHNQVPRELLEDKALAAAMSMLPKNYNFEVHKSIWRLRTAKSKLLALQFPEGLLLYACTLADIFKAFAGVEDCIVMGDVAYGACCVDDFSARALGADFLIHYGHSCLVPVDITSMPCMYVFVDIAFDLEHLVDCIQHNFRQEQTIALAGTIQFTTSVVQVKARLAAAYPHMGIPQVKPLSGGEVLGCTAPTLPADTDALVFVADGRFHLESIMIANPTVPAFRYDPYSRLLTREEYDQTGMRAVRRRAIEAARLARRFGIILGTLGRQGNPAILAHLEALFTGRGMRYSVVLLSEISPAKLNAMSDVEAWVQIACPRLSIDWGEGFRIPARTRHTQHTPAAWTSGVLCCVPAVKLMLMTVSLWFRGLLLSQVLTPYEAEVAFGEIPPFWDESKGSSGCDGAGSGGASCGAGGTCGRNDGGSCSGAGAGPDAGVGAGNRRVAAYPMDFYAKDSGPWGNGFHNSRRTVPGRPPGVR